MARFNSLLEWPIPEVTQTAIVRQFWDAQSNKTIHSYFQYYTEQCKIAYSINQGGMRDKTHQHIIDIVKGFKGNLTRQEIREETAKKNNAVNCGCTSDDLIDLGVRLALMLDVGELRNAYSGRKRLIWKDGQLKQFVRDVFPDTICQDHTGVKLSSSFTARSLNYVTGFKVELTTNLADHLRWRERDKTLSIFHHASFLQCQQGNTIFPDGFVDETLRTLALLFPQRDKKTKQWYLKQEELQDLDLGVLQCGRIREEHLQIEKYIFWHDRLVILNEAFETSQPTNIWQLWKDRRDSNKWFTLWVVIFLTLLFGLIQSIEGAFQVYKAYHPSS